MHFRHFRSIVGVTFSPSLIVPLLASVLFAAACNAEVPVWPVDGPAFSAPVDEIQKAAAEVTREQFMEATILFERDAYTLDAEGRVTLHHSMIYRIETQEGVNGWSESSEHWNPWYQKQPEIHARVIQADGKVSQLDQKTITDGPAKESDEDTYTDERIRKAPLPGLALGAIVEEETVLEDKSPFFSGGGVYRRYFSRSAPVVRTELLVEAPVGLKLRYDARLLPQLSVTKEERAGTQLLKFDQGYLAAEEDSDIDLPTHESPSAMVEFSTGGSWGAVASAYRQLAEPQIDPEKVRGMLPKEASASRLETIQHIVSRLHKEIRYTGIEFGQSSLQPQTASEVIKRHYGDCKDKAALLVGLLRAAGIAANLALLDSGPGADVTPELPGMNEFDHAIVYVPGDTVQKEPALWIDATAEFAEIPSLPSMDQGRLALIIAEGTTGLTETPEARPEDNSLTEDREIVMAEYGPSHITETTLTRGEVDETYRSDFGGTETRETKTNLENYAKEEYLAKALTKVDHGDGTDIGKPFILKLDMAEAKRGNTQIDDAAVAIPFAGVFSRLPGWFRRDPKAEGEKLTPQQEEDQKRAIAARANEYDVAPILTEWNYKITPPEGFELRTLPEDKSIEMGPAKLTEHFETDSNGMIKAVLSFSSVKPRYSVVEAVALRDAVLAAYKQDMIMVIFDQVGSKLIAEGKIREALAADRKLIDHHPTEALHHIQMAYALLEAGMGDRARAEAQQGAKLDPKSANAFRALGWVCQFNSIGIQFAHGFNWDCAQEGFAHARELDPEDLNTRVNLALIDEYNPNGDRYSEGALLKDAIREYQELKEKDKETGDQYEDNLLFDLLYSRQYGDLLKELEKLPASVNRDGLGITAAVAMKPGEAGIKAGIDRADHLPAGAQGRNQALSASGGQLMHLRLYTEAAAILAAAVEGESNAAAVTQQIEMFRHLTPWKKEYLPATDPASVVQRMFMAILTGEYTERLNGEVLSRHAYGSEGEWKRNYEKAAQSQGLLRVYSAQSNLPESVLLDLISGNLKFSSEGDDKTGYRVSVESLGSQTQLFFVSREEAGFKIVTDGKTPSEVGNEVVYLLSKGKDAEARSLLDWERDLMHRGGGDDSLAGPLLPRFWTTGESSGKDAMQLAAAALLANDAAIKDLLPAVHSAWEKSTDDEERASLGLVLANGYIEIRDGAAARAAVGELLKKYPDSNVALNLAGGADVLLKDLADWDALIDKRLKVHPKDEDLLRIKANAAEWKGDFALARATEQQVMDIGKAKAGDYNSYAWTGLFDGKVGDDVVKAAQQATLLTKNATFAELHTLACIYAVQGKTKEARELLLKAMTLANLSEPNSEVWFGFGSIYEQYGVNDAATEAYRKVEKPEGFVAPTSTWVLAQNRLKALGAISN